eukprot:1990902-Amphidinium_carterae.1
MVRNSLQFWDCQLLPRSAHARARQLPSSRADIYYGKATSASHGAMHAEAMLCGFFRKPQQAEGGCAKPTTPQQTGNTWSKPAYSARRTLRNLAGLPVRAREVKPFKRDLGQGWA